MAKAAQAARDGKGPQLVVGRLLRLSGHGEHDDGSYVPDELRLSAVGRDCMDVAEKQLVEGAYFTADEIAALKEEFTAEVQAATAIAQKDPDPNPYKEDWTAISNPLLRDGHL